MKLSFKTPGVLLEDALHRQIYGAALADVVRDALFGLYRVSDAADPLFETNDAIERATKGALSAHEWGRL